MYKIKEADLRRWCKDASYSGEDTPAAMLTWLKGQYGSIEVEGKTHDLNECEVEVETKAAFKPAVETKTLPQVDDTDAKVKSLVADALKAAGVETGVKRPRLVTPETPAITVKDMAEVEYESRAKSGKSAFTEYQRAKMAQHWYASEMARVMNKPELQSHHGKKFQELHTRITGKAYASNDVDNGSALVPEVFVPDMIRLVEMYGHARTLCAPTIMSKPKQLYPRRTGGLTAYFVAQNANATASTGTYDNVELNAKDSIVYTSLSLQMFEDSAVSMVDELMIEMARAQAVLEDDCFFKGNTNAASGGITGFEFKYGLTATDGGYVVVGGADTTAHTAAQLDSAIGRLPLYAYPGARFTCHPHIGANVFDRLSTSTPGGLTMVELLNGRRVQAWKGIPIIYNQSMSSVLVASTTNRAGGFTAGDQIDILLGDFSKAAKFGILKDVSMEFDRSVLFQSYAMAARAVFRFDQVVHDVGDSTTAGPVVSFWQT